jgi:predicted transcriptional regulator
MALSDPLITASITLDYLGAVQINEWLEVRLEHSRKGRQSAFADVSLHIGERTVARASAVFALPLS